jgi:hypothetical protein
MQERCLSDLKEPLMLKRISLTAIVAVFCGSCLAQSARPAFFNRARIQHSGATVTVTANDSMPLSQAIDALRLEYGWRINVESAPCYSRFDLADDTGPEWRAAHPDSRGVTGPSGGLFIANFTDPGDGSDFSAEYRTISAIVNAYNATNNPGRYVLLRGPYGGLTVVGTGVRDETGALVEVPPLLGAHINLVASSRTVEGTLEAIRGALQLATGKEVLDGDFSHSLLLNTHATVGGEGVAARELLEEALSSTGRALEYDLSYDADSDNYVLNTYSVARLGH